MQFGSGSVRKRIQVIPDRLDAGLCGIRTFGEVAVEIQVHGVNVVRAGKRIGIGDVRGRGRGIAVAVGPEDRIAGAQHHVIRAGAAHDRLMIVVAHGVLVGEGLQDRNVSLLDVVERHGIAAAIVVNAGGLSKLSI